VSQSSVEFGGDFLFKDTNVICFQSDTKLLQLSLVESLILQYFKLSKTGHSASFMKSIWALCGCLKVANVSFKSHNFQIGAVIC